MSSKRIIVVLGVLIVIAFGYIGYSDAVRTWQNLQNQKNHIENLNQEYKKLDKELDKTKETKQKSQEEVQKLEQEKKKLEEERQKLQSQLQAKVEAKAKLAAASRAVINKATNTQTASAMSGSCSDWLAQAGITNAIAVDLIGRESGCNPGVVNRSSGACGIPQALPCSKLPCSLDSAGAVCQLKWMQNYVYGRYGSWAGAKDHHDRMGWY